MYIYIYIYMTDSSIALSQGVMSTSLATPGKSSSAPMYCQARYGVRT